MRCVLADEVVVEGMHWKSPFGQFIKWPAMYKRINMEQTCNSKDGIEITLSFSFQCVGRTRGGVGGVTADQITHL